MQHAASFRLVLPSAAAVGRLHGLAADEAWRGVERREASSTHAAMQGWEVPPSGTLVYEVDDGFLGQTWLHIEGDGALALAQRLGPALGATDLETTLKALRAPGLADAERGLLLRRVGVLCAEERSDVMHLIADALACADASPRAAALEVIAALGWPSLRPLVNAMLTIESTPALKARALQVAQAFGMR